MPSAIDISTKRTLPSKGDERKYGVPESNGTSGTTADPGG